jgi:predicted nuclease with RNAse H fold
VSATFGIDLASQPSNTGVCRIEWEPDGSGYVHCPGDHGSDPDLLSMMSKPDVTRVGIDAPFGWPETFIEAVVSYTQGGGWPDGPGQDFHQNLMRLRVTDRVVTEHTKLVPLSVTTDRIGVTAMRCARLLAAHHAEMGAQIDRSGQGRVVEVYPAAALVCWGLSPKFAADDPGSYKGGDSRAKARRERLVDQIVDAGEGWLDLPEKVRIVCRDSDDCLDAMLSALVARAAELGRVEPVSDPGAAVVEGWIALPTGGSLASSCRL